MADGGVPQGGTLVHRDQDSPALPSRGDLIERFISLSGTLTRPSTVAGAAEAIGAAALALTGGRHGAVYLHAANGETTCVWASHNGFPQHRGPSGPGPVLLSDLRDLPQDDEVRRAAEREGYRALAYWPLSRAGTTIGSIACYFDAPRSWSPAELDVMFALALQGAAALERALRSDGPDRAVAEVDAEDARIAEALRILQAESAELFETHRELEAQNGRLIQARQELSALNVWFLAVQNELQAERARLAAEQVQLTKTRDDLASEDARLTAAREALETQIAAARQELEKESARLAEMRRELLDTHTPQTETRREPPADQTRVSDARRALEEESARLMEALEIDSPPRADAPKVLEPAMAPAEPSTDPAPAQSPSNGGAHPAGPGSAYELGGPLPAPRAVEEVYPLLVERAAKLLNQERGSLKAEEQVAMLGRALDDRDGHRAGYSERIAAWTEATAGMLGCGRDDIADVRRAALLHDLGKIGVPEAILRATARLTEQERRIVRSVPTLAEQVLRPVKGMQGVAAILRHRYEQWDGKGYPDGLKGDKIPLGARILAVVEAYGVMTTVRPYRAMVYSLDAVAELRRCAGAQFDPRVVEAFCNVLKREG